MELIKFYINNTYQLNKSVFLFLFFYSLCHQIKAQVNLVPNGSFEEYNNCPDYANGFYIEACKFWTNPTLGTSDYFNSCSTEQDGSGNYLFSVPENYIGFQQARTGDAYTGFSFTQVDFPDIYWQDETFSEYMQVKLNHQLEVGKFYHLQFFVANASENICSNSIGCLFTNQELHVNNDKILLQTPQYQSDLEQFFCDSTKWFEINYKFQALGNENYFSIGVFTPLYINQTSDYNGNIISGPGQFGAIVYLYIDDVSLIEIDSPIPNVFTPNLDGINDLFFIDKNIFQATEIQIFNRWGNVVYHSDNSFQWDGTSNGDDVTEGVYFYLIKTKNNKSINGFVSLIR
jgi:gliding motility-associated-like protein